MPEQTQAPAATETKEPSFAEIFDHTGLDDEGWPVEEEAAETETEPEETEEAPSEEDTEEVAQPEEEERAAAPAASAQTDLDARLARLEEDNALLRQLVQRQSKPEDKPAEKKAADPLDVIDQLTDDDFDPRLTGVLKALKSELTTSRQENQQLRQVLEQKEGEAFLRDFDQWTAEHDAEFFGEGPTQTIQRDSDGAKRRSEAMHLMDGITAAYRNIGVTLTPKQAFEIAVGGIKARGQGSGVRGQKKTAKPAQAAEDEAPAPAPTNGAARAELERRKQLYAGAATQRPEQRATVEPASEQKAIRNLGRFMKERGFAPADDEDNGFPG